MLTLGVSPQNNNQGGPTSIVPTVPRSVLASSGFRGVTKNVLKRKGEGGEDAGEYRHSSVVFAANVCYKGKTYRCGTYHTAEEAARAYDAKVCARPRSLSLLSRARALSLSLSLSLSLALSLSFPHPRSRARSLSVSLSVSLSCARSLSVSLALSFFLSLTIERALFLPRSFSYSRLCAHAFSLALSPRHDHTMSKKCRQIGKPTSFLNFPFEHDTD